MQYNPARTDSNPQSKYYKNNEYEDDYDEEEELYF
jgi:hypothetical protein